MPTLAKKFRRAVMLSLINWVEDNPNAGTYDLRIVTKNEGTMFWLSFHMRGVARPISHQQTILDSEKKYDGFAELVSRGIIRELERKMKEA